jgi:hypothetical protein
MTRALTLAMIRGPSLAQTLACETSVAYRHCWDKRGDKVITERSVDHTHG